MLSGGLLNKQIAYELGVSEATVKAHVSAILQKLGVESRTQAVIAAGKIEAGNWPQMPARGSVIRPCEEPTGPARSGRPNDRLRDEAIQHLRATRPRWIASLRSQR